MIDQYCKMVRVTFDTMTGSNFRNSSYAMRINRLQFVAFVVVLSCIIGTANVSAAIVSLHQGGTDPSDEGFSINQFFNPLPSTQYGSIFDDRGFDAIFIDDNDLVLETNYVQRLASSEVLDAMTSGWTLNTRLRVVDSPDNLDAGISVEFATGQRRFSLTFGSTTEGNPIVAVTDKGSARIVERFIVDDVFGGYHLYSLVFDPTIETADAYVDGVLAIESYAGFISSAPAG